MQVRRILAIDGGGVKGAYAASFLPTIEDATGKRIADHFDLVAGTSTGASSRWDLLWESRRPRCAGGQQCSA